MYDLARETGRLLAEKGFAVVTGGGPGIMEAANRGAREAGGLSVGFPIKLPHAELENQYLDISFLFEHFYARKTMLVKAAEGFILFPGGFGTLDELFESLVLIQTGEVKHFPAVLMGQSYWEGMLAWIRRHPLAEGMISPEDLDLLFVTNDPADSGRDDRRLLQRKCARAAGRAGQGRRAVAVDLAADDVDAAAPELRRAGCRSRSGRQASPHRPSPWTRASSS